MKRRYRNYSDKDIIEAVANSLSLADVLRKIDIKPVGGNYMTIKLIIKRLDLDTSHFTGQGWNRNKFIVPLNLKRNATRIKLHLISIRGHKCEDCNKRKWKNSAIPLELEHCDGNSLNHQESNLKLLCTNCHAFTRTYRRAKSSL